jgi:hypothetical protein
MNFISKWFLNGFRKAIKDAQDTYDNLNAEDICEAIDLFAEFMEKNSSKIHEISEKVATHILSSEKVMNAVVKVTKDSTEMVHRVSSNQDLIDSFKVLKNSIESCQIMAEYKYKTQEELIGIKFDIEYDKITKSNQLTEQLEFFKSGTEELTSLNKWYNDLCSLIDSMESGDAYDSDCYERVSLDLRETYNKLVTLHHSLKVSAEFSKSLDKSLKEYDSKIEYLDNLIDQK